MSYEISRHWRLREQRLRLIGEKCPHCETVIFPPRDICPSCLQDAKINYQLSGKGTVYSYTVVRRDNAPEGMEKYAPYVVAIVETDEGARLTAQITDIEWEWKEETVGEETVNRIYPKVEIGMRVEGITRRLKEEGDRGLIIYGYKFRPVLQRQEDPGDGRVQEPAF